MARRCENVDIYLVGMVSHSLLSGDRQVSQSIVESFLKLFQLIQISEAELADSQSPGYVFVHEESAECAFLQIRHLV